jgi:ethanolamine ammonia-lyase small subunit
VPYVDQPHPDHLKPIHLGTLSETESPSLIPTILDRIRARTPARIFTGPTSSTYRTSTYLSLRSDHAAAKDAVVAEFDLISDFGIDFVTEWNLFEIATLAKSKEEFLVRPELGRSLAPAAHDDLRARCSAHADIQVVIADGLSAAAIRAQVPALLPRLAAEATKRAWRFGQPFFVRHGRVGLMNDVGVILDAKVVILLIGERPGLTTAESLSAYMAYQPRLGHDDSRRNLISNIHAQGIPADQAAIRIARLADLMIQLCTSGVAIKEQGVADQGLPSRQPSELAI